MSDARPRGFASDNSAGVHPSVLAAIAAVNEGHALAYGHDPYTQEIERRVAAQFGEHAQAFFVFNGSAANVLSLRAACRPWQGAICAESAHVNVDECGDIDRRSGQPGNGRDLQGRDRQVLEDAHA